MSCTAIGTASRRSSSSQLQASIVSFSCSAPPSDNFCVTNSSIHKSILVVGIQRHFSPYHDEDDDEDEDEVAAEEDGGRAPAATAAAEDEIGIGIPKDSANSGRR